MTDTLGYVRVSTEQQATEQKTSLGDQRRAIIDHAKQLGRVLDPSSIFEDAGFSGATAEGRPGFMALYRYCEANTRAANRRGMILVLNDSRFGRFDDPEEASHHRFVLKQLGWDVRFVEADDVRDPLSRSLIRVVHSAQATTYRTTLRVRAKAAARSNALLGRWQQEAPFGYRRLATRADGAQRVMAIGQRKAADEVSRLTLGPDDEVQAVRWMFETYAAGGISMYDLAREMERRFPTRAKWSNVRCRQILHNPAYVGDIIWCRRVTDKAERLEQKIRAQSEWVIVPDAHPAIVTRALRDAVHARFAGNKRQTTATRGGYPLTGLIRCSQCGNHFAGGGGRKGPAGDVDRYRFYKDTGNSKRKPECAPATITLRKSWIERVVIDAVSEFVARPETQDTIRREMSRLLREAKSDSRGRRSQLEKDRLQLLRQRKRLVDAIAGGTLTEAEASINLAEVRSRLSAIDGEIERVRFAARATVTMGAEIERMVQLAQDFPTQVRRLTGTPLREVLQPWIASAVVDKQKRVLILDLCPIPEGTKVLRLGNSPEPGTQDNTIDRRLTTRRRIRIPRQQVQLQQWCRRRQRARA